jgi:hypothetical protein
MNECYYVDTKKKKGAIDVDLLFGGSYKPPEDLAMGISFEITIDCSYSKFTVWNIRRLLFARSEEEVVGNRRMCI